MKLSALVVVVTISMVSSDPGFVDFLAKLERAKVNAINNALDTVHDFGRKLFSPPRPEIAQQFNSAVREAAFQPREQVSFQPREQVPFQPREQVHFQPREHFPVQPSVPQCTTVQVPIEVCIMEEKCSPRSRLECQKGGGKCKVVTEDVCQFEPVCNRQLTSRTFC